MSKKTNLRGSTRFLERGYRVWLRLGIFAISLIPHVTINAQTEIPKCRADLLQLQHEWDKLSANRVHKRTTWKYEILEGALTRERERWEVYTFANSGHLIEITNFVKNDNIESILAFDYDAEGKPIEKTLFDPTGDIVEQFLYTYYDNNDLRILTQTAGNNQVMQRISYQQLYEKNIVKVTWFSPDNKPFKRIDYFYNSLDTGSVIKEIHYKGTEEIRYSIRKFYDNVKLTTDSVFYSNGLFSHTLSYLYNPAGYLAEKQKLSPRRELLGREVFQYNPEGFISGYTVYGNRGEMQIFVKYSYTFY